MYSILSFAKEKDQDEVTTPEPLAKFFCPESWKPEGVKDTRVKEVLYMSNSQNPIDVDLVGLKCLEIYGEEKAKMKEMFRKHDGQICLSVDILRAGKRYKSGSGRYLCLGAHFIDDDWTLKRWTLSFSLIGTEGEGSPHEIILKAMKEWGIKQKVSTITMLNGNDSKETLELVKDHINGMKRLQLNGQLFQMYCSADMLNQAVQSAYEGIGPIVDKIGKYYPFGGVVSTWKYRSSLLKDSFRLKLIEVPKGMGDTYGSLPSNKEWSIVSDVIDLVDDIYDIVYPLIETGYQPSSTFLPQLQELQRYLIEKNTHANAFMRKNVVGNMLLKVKEYINEKYLVLAVSSVLDPRFKMEYTKFSSSKFEREDGNSKVNTVLEAVRDLYNEYVVRFPAGPKTARASARTPKKGKIQHREPPQSAVEVEKMGIFNHVDEWTGLGLLKEYKQFIKGQTKKSELDCYLEEPVIPWSQEFNALDWWKTARFKYPTLAKMARDLFAIPVSISLGDEATLMKQRKADYCVISSGPELMNAFVCVRDWFLKN